MSSFSPPARRGVGYCCASSCGAGGFPRHVLLQVTLRGFRNLSGSRPVLLLQWSFVVGFAVSWCAAWFSTLCRALPPGPAVGAAYPAAGYPWGFSAFCVTGCLPYCCSGGVGWATTLPFYYLCFCAGWLAGVCWVLHPGSGSPLWGCVCSLSDSVIALLTLPYLKVGALLACGVCGVC